MIHAERRDRPRVVNAEVINEGSMLFLWVIVLTVEEEEEFLLFLLLWFLVSLFLLILKGIKVNAMSAYLSLKKM